MKASVATATRYDSVACDERNFSSSEERALALLTLVSRGVATCRPCTKTKTKTKTKTLNTKVCASERDVSVLTNRSASAAKAQQRSC